MKGCCENCRYWISNGEAGDCRRRAPSITLQALWPSPDREWEDALIAYWPNTSAQQWCGEFEADA